MQVKIENELMNLKQVSEKVHYSRASIYRLMEGGKFPKSVNLGGRSVFWVKSHIDDFINSHVNKP